MEFTGERFMPGMNGQIESEHIHRYLIGKEYAKNKVVLDIASGEGYGTKILTESAQYVYGVDISSEAVDYARKKYSSLNNVEFIEGNCAAIPLPADSVDMVCSFETIEHHDQHHEMMEEILRVMKPDGVLMMSSPDKYVYSDSVNYQNPFHVKELYDFEFESLIRSYFKNAIFHRQKVFYGSIVSAAGINDEFIQFRIGEANAFRSQLDAAPYLIAVASNSELPNPCYGIFESSVERAELVLAMRSKIATLHEKLKKRRGPIRYFLRSLKKRIKA